MREQPESWPELKLEDWKDTYATVHLWTQMLGKTRLALLPLQNHYWHSALYLTARGLTTGPMPSGPITAEVELDFLDHLLVVRRSDGFSASRPLRSGTIAEFHADYVALLHDARVNAKLWGVPVEIAEAIPFARDHANRDYDGDAIRRAWRILLDTERVLQRFRTGYLGKCSPVHFWWGAFDLAHTRFSGRPAPEHPGGVPNLADYVVRESYSHECMSAGWWPGNPGGPVAEAAFYAYAYPEHAGFSEAAVRPDGAFYHPDLREWVLPYEVVRTAADPDGSLAAFFEDVYGAAASLGAWDRASLERFRMPGR